MSEPLTAPIPITTKPAGAADVRGNAMAGGSALLLPGEHFAAALCFLAAGSVGLIWVAPELANGLYLSPHVVAVTHCFTLGWLSTTIFGALYQLLPVVLRVPIRSTWWGHASFWSYAPGVALFAGGLAAGSLPIRHVGVALVAFGIVSLVINVALSLRAAPRRGVVWAAIAVALTFLVSTVGIGLTLLRSLDTGFLAGERVRVLALHFHVAMIGWLLIMVVGISYRLLPMFLLAHLDTTKLTRNAIASLAAGVVALAAGLLPQTTALNGRLADVLAWAGIACIEAGLLFYLEQARRVYKARMRPKLDAGLRHVAMALVFMSVSAVLGPVVFYEGSAHSRLGVAYVTMALLGGLVLLAVGQFYKIVPFLVWISRFRNDLGRRKVPSVGDLYSARVAHCGFLALSLAIVLLVTGETLGALLIVRAGALSFATGVGLFVSQMLRMAFVPGRDPTTEQAVSRIQNVGATR